MSTSSTNSYGVQRRKDVYSRRKPVRPASQKHGISREDAYSFALRSAYLWHLLQPKSKRLQHTAAPLRPQVQRQTSSVAETLRGLTVSKSTHLPRGFGAELDKRISGVLMGKEKSPEFADPVVKRTFAVFLNEFKKPERRKTLEQDRRVEGLILTFVNYATKELEKTKKAPDDDSYKLMVDRHVALFVRLIRSILRSNDWNKDRTELTDWLQTVENKFLVHDQDLTSASQRNGGAGGTTQEVEVPRSQYVKDMPHVLTVAAIFGKELPQVQSDLDAKKSTWTEKAALQDLKLYQTNLSLNSRRTLREDDFDTNVAYETWKKGETQELSHMMLSIIQADPELAKTTAGIVPKLQTTGSPTTMNAPDLAMAIASDPNGSAAYTLASPIDLSGLDLNSDPTQTSGGAEQADVEPFTFIPPEPRNYYRQIVREALTTDTHSESGNGASEVSPGAEQVKLLSKKSLDLLNELGLRWRVPHSSRLVLFLDAIREKYAEREIDLETLDAAFLYAKDPPFDKKVDISQVLDRSLWTMADFVLNQQILSSVHDALLRDLFEAFQQCYSTGPTDIGPLMTVLETHIYDDPIFSKTPEDIDRFSERLEQALAQKAGEIYKGLFNREIGLVGEDAQFYHVIQLAKATVKFVERVQKRYRKTPTIMGVEPATILVKVVMPTFAADAKEQVTTIMQRAQARDEEIPVQDGFDLYKEMVNMRSLHAAVLPGVKFSFDIETVLEPFVRRWIAATEENMVKWVDAAVMQDSFQVRTEDANQVPSEDERHSVSVIDIFRSFNQAVDQVVQLEWDDDLQYAKFMTSLSKSIGAGITNYCEHVEKLFVQEMDRLTQEQEAAALAQSKQEKWMKMAKDALSTKEKVQPFQFLPTSFVKLNNIEWAMQQLDNVEKEVNVDACAAVIDKSEPPPPPRHQRKQENFVFTIKIIEGEDLKACDVNGLSDPYVVLGDEYHKRLAKTRIVYGNLNPRWDETVDINTQGPINIIATIWDWDMMGDHDCVGRTSIKLDPSHFKDYLPREFWLDLDTQGRLLVRASMEGEKDDIRFYFGKAFRALKRTERDMTRKITDKLSTYIHQCLSTRTLRSLTSRGLSMSTISSMSSAAAISSVAGYFNRGKPQAPAQPVPTAEIENALKPLFTYFNENFAIMNETLTRNAMISVMTRLWKETLSTIESLLVPPLSDKPSGQRQLSEQELDIVFKWLQMLFDFFHVVDEDTGVAQGVPLDVLKSPKYHDLKNLHFFYYEPTDNLIRTSERMAAANAERARQAQAGSGNRFSAPGGALAAPSFSGAGGPLSAASTKRSKSVMQKRNLGTMKKAKEEKRKEAQAEASDDLILRILRMRPDAERYLRDRSRQKERLAAVAAAERIVQQSLAQGAARDRERRPVQRNA